MKYTEIKVKDLSGKVINLIDEYPDKNLLLIFYNNQCLGCTGRAIPLAYDLNNDFDCVQVIGIHSDFGAHETTADEIMSIFTIDRLPFPIYLDHKGSVYNHFNCEGTPHWILLKKGGVLANSIFGSQAGSQNRLDYALLEMCSEESKTAYVSQP